MEKERGEKEKLEKERIERERLEEKTEKNGTEGRRREEEKKTEEERTPTVIPPEPTVSSIHPPSTQESSSAPPQESDNLVSLTLVDETGQARIRYYSDCTLHDLADYLDQSGAKAVGSYYFSSNDGQRIYPLSTFIGDIPFDGESILLRLKDRTSMRITATFTDFNDINLHYPPDATIRDVRKDLSQ